MRFRPKKKSSIGGVRIGRKSDNGNKKPALAFTLNHGDIVVMHGTAIHKYYEVCMNLALTGIGQEF